METSMKYILLLIFIFTATLANADIKDKIQHLNWDGIDVVWLEDERFPTYSIEIYFADGGLSDEKGYEGESNMMFDLLDSGTRRFSHQDIVDNLEFYGVSYGASVTHEFSSYSISGLVKDITPTMKKICHIFNDATFPKVVIEKELKRVENDLINMVNSQGGLASRAFRELSLEGSGFEYPSSGKLKNIKRFSEDRFRKKLDYYNKKVKKRIYIAGPKDSLSVKNIFHSDCNWKSDVDFVREPKLSQKLISDSSTIHLITVPQANQSQVRVGRFLKEDEVNNEELKYLVSEYLGGGFTSQLMREIRVKRGLTYGINSYIGSQKYYGRAIITTSTRNEKVSEMITEIKNVLDKLNAGQVDEVDFTRARGSLSGGHPFRFENLDSFLNQLMFYDHIKRDYSELYSFQDKVNALKVEDMVAESNRVFDWSKQTIVVLGPKSLAKELKAFGKVKIHNYRDFL